MRGIILGFCIILATFMANGQDIKAYSADDIMTRISNNDTFYVVNFWATWCGPCVKELPEFDKIPTTIKGKPVKTLLVSLDFKKDYPSKIEKFIKKKHLQHEVAWLNETNANEFIPKIDALWQGSIPATLLFYKKTAYQGFFEGTVKAEQLLPLIEKQFALDN